MAVDGLGEGFGDGGEHVVGEGLWGCCWGIGCRGGGNVRGCERGFRGDGEGFVKEKVRAATEGGAGMAGCCRRVLYWESLAVQVREDTTETHLEQPIPVHPHRVRAHAEEQEHSVADSELDPVVEGNDTEGRN